MIWQDWESSMQNGPNPDNPQILKILLLTFLRRKLGRHEAVPGIYEPEIQSRPSCPSMQNRSPQPSSKVPGVIIRPLAAGITSARFRSEHL